MRKCINSFIFSICCSAVHYHFSFLPLSLLTLFVFSPLQLSHQMKPSVSISRFVFCFFNLNRFDSQCTPLSLQPVVLKSTFPKRVPEDIATIHYNPGKANVRRLQYGKVILSTSDEQMQKIEIPYQANVLQGYVVLCCWRQDRINRLGNYYIGEVDASLNTLDCCIGGMHFLIDIFQDCHQKHKAN